MTSSSSVSARLTRADAAATKALAAELLREVEGGADLSEPLPSLLQAIRRWERGSHYTPACHSVEIAAAQAAEEAARALCEVVVAHALRQRARALLSELLFTTEHGYHPNLFVSATVALSKKGRDISLALALLSEALTSGDLDRRIKVARILAHLAGTPRSVQRVLVAQLEPATVAAMEASLDAPEERLRRSLSRLLAVYHLHRGSHTEIEALLHREDTAVRAGATRALLAAPLGGLDITFALPRLRALSTDPDEALAADAKKALEHAEKVPVRGG